ISVDTFQHVRIRHGPAPVVGVGAVAVPHRARPAPLPRHARPGQGAPGYLWQPVDLLQQQLALSVDVADEHERGGVVHLAQDLLEQLTGRPVATEVNDPRSPCAGHRRHRAAGRRTNHYDLVRFYLFGQLAHLTVAFDAVWTAVDDQVQRPPDVAA